MKRFFDVSCACILLILFMPLIILVSLLVRLNLGSPVLFKQERPGLYCEPFYIYKFRTMIHQADSNDQLLTDEERLTRLGRWLRKLSLDELPQLVNVIIGDQSLVGPRPLLMEYLPRYNAEQIRRHAVRPGITGWAQVNGRNAIGWDEKFKLDVWYVDHQSFWLDLKILGLTIIKVFRSEGISQKGNATMAKFDISQNAGNRL